MLSEILSPMMLWFIATIAILGAEMLIGTYYLLALACGALVGGLTAYFSHTIDHQFTAAGIATFVSIIGTYYYKRAKRGKEAKLKLNPNCLDAGAVITVNKVNADGSGSTTYRGASWQVLCTNGDLVKDLNYTILDIKGSVLIVSSDK